MVCALHVSICTNTHFPSLTLTISRFTQIYDLHKVEFAGHKPYDYEYLLMVWDHRKVKSE